MVLEGLGQSLRDVLKKVANSSNVDDKLIKEVSKDIQRALLQADVNVKMVLEITKEVERRALTEKPPAGKSGREQVIKIIYDELVKILGEQRTLPLGKQVIMMVGLYGQGKTTTAGKLGRYFHKKGLKVGLIAADVHRPAAYDQLKQIGDKVGVQVYGSPAERSAVKIVATGMREFSNLDVVIIDTSGRHALEGDLIDEIKEVAKIANPTERILVLDASVGQQAGPQAQAFHDAVGVTSVILTKMDGTAKGGGALSAVSRTKAPIVFIGVGEHLEDLDPFIPSRFISRLLGMGDLQSLMETAKESHHRGAGDGDDQEDHVRQVLPKGDVRADGDAHQHGPAEEAHEHAAGHGRRSAGQDQRRGDAGAPAPLPDDHGLHDRRGDGEPQAHQVLPGRCASPAVRAWTPRTCGSCCSSTTPPRRRSRGSWATASCGSS